MAEGKERWKKKIEPSEILAAYRRYGFIVLSAGLAALSGGEAAPEAIETARELGADLRGHSSRPLTSRLVAQADYLIAMTHGHLLALASQFNGIGPRPRLLSEHGEDLPDPIGCEQTVYQECAQRIVRDLETLVPQFQQGGWKRNNHENRNR